MFTLRVVFAGGYIFDFHDSTAVHVDSVAAAHPMKYQIQQAGEPVRDIKGTLSLWPDGVPPAPLQPSIPSNTSETGCTAPSDLNQMRFIPNLDAAATHMKTTVKTRAERQRFGSIKLTGGGALKVVALAACVEFRKDNQPIPPSSLMAHGVNGIAYEWSVEASALTIVDVTDIGSSQISVPPSNGEIEILISTFENPPPVPPTPHEIEHFRMHFAAVFHRFDPAVSLWWLQPAKRPLDPGFRSPGIDCPPGSTGA